MTSLSSFEILPDEIILQICSYLHGADVLYSLYNLNARLNVTITGYCHYVDLSGVTYYRFDHVVSHIFPQIALDIRSFVFHGHRDRTMCANASIAFFGSPMSFIFPRLQKITLYWFTFEKLLSFIDILENLSQLVELNIQCFTGAVKEPFLTKVLAANNGRLQSVSFDEDSVFLDVSKIDQAVHYVNIQKLIINITSQKMLPHLFALIPYVRRLYVRIEQRSYNSNLKQAFDKLSPLTHLIDFHLYSIIGRWDFDEIAGVLQLMPSLQALTFKLSTKDEHFVKPENFVKILPQSLKQICFCIRYYFQLSVCDVKDLTDSWSILLPINCLLDEINARVIMLTASFGLRSLELPETVGKQIVSGCKYTQGVKNLRVDDSVTLTDILLTVQHFRCLRKLRINIQDTKNACKCFRYVETDLC